MESKKLKENNKRDRAVIIALDFKNGEEALSFLEKFDESLYVKVGMELFYKEGPEIIREIKKRGHRIFLDLKFHDIPNTVSGAIRSCFDLNVDMMNLHGAGGKRMMEEANEIIKGSDKKALLIAVTMLTSTSQEEMEEDLLIKEDLNKVVLHYARKAKEAGLPGIVCSAKEVALVKKELGEDFICVTPGIRLKSDSLGDQVRVVSPKDAREIGSDYIVVGRPITKAENPVMSYREIKRDFLED